MALKMDLGGITELSLRLIRDLVTLNHEQCFTARHWTLVMETLGRVYESYLPGDLFEITAVAEGQYPQKSSGHSAVQFDVNMSAASVTFPERHRLASRTHDNELTELQFLAKQCSAQYMLLELFREMSIKAEGGRSILSSKSTISYDSVKSFLNLLLRGYEFAVSFNGNIPLRQVMVNAGLGESLELVVLNRQETGSLLLLMEILYGFYEKGLTKTDPLQFLPDNPKAARELSQRYFEVSTVALQRCIEMRLPSSPRRKFGKSWNDVATTVIRQWAEITNLLDQRAKDSNVELFNLGECMFETQISVTLEFCLLTDRSHHVYEMTKDFILNSNKRLQRLRLESLGLGRVSNQAFNSSV